MVEDVDIGGPGVPLPNCRTWRPDRNRLDGLAGGHLAAGGCRGELGAESGRQQLGSARDRIEMHPQRHGLDTGAAVPGDRDAPLGPTTAQTGAEGGQLEDLTLFGGADLMDAGPSHHPGLGLGESELGRVIGGDILQQAGDGIEP